jgi:hypothetical protein
MTNLQTLASKQQLLCHNETLVNLGDLENLRNQYKPSTDESLLHTAIKAGHLGIIEFLLKKDLSPDGVAEGEPAICLATRLDQCAVVALLVKHGAKLAVSDA